MNVIKTNKIIEKNKINYKITIRNNREKKIQK